jgi:hypothetical protein
LEHRPADDATTSITLYGVKCQLVERDVMACIAGDLIPSDG